VTVRGVVLAGGHSRRFGDANKATAVLAGTPLVARAVDAAAAATGRPPLVAVQTDAQRDELAAALDASVSFVRDAPGYDGPLAGLVAAARRATADSLVAVACDMPFASADALDWVARQAGDAAAVVPVAGGAVQPLHARYATAPLAAGPDTDARLVALLDELDAERVPAAASPPSVPLAASLTNVNTRRDLAAARAARRAP